MTWSNLLAHEILCNKCFDEISRSLVRLQDTHRIKIKCLLQILLENISIAVFETSTS